MVKVDTGSVLQEETKMLEDFCENRTEELRNNLISSHIALVEVIARHFHFQSHGEPLEDLIQVGTIGLIKAVDRFDPTKKTQFNTYATHQISGEIRHYLRDKINLIKQPRWLRFLMYQIFSKSEELAQKIGRHPSVKEIADALNIREEGIVLAIKLQEELSCTSMETGKKENIQNLAQKIRAQKLVSFQLPIEDKIILFNAFEKLLEIERKAVYLFFYYDLTQSEIGQQMGLSQRKVSRLIQKALDKLKKVLEPIA